MLVSGQPHLEAPFGVVHRGDDGKDTVYSFRTPLTDIGHVISDPANFLKGRVNPLTIRTAIELQTGRNQMGQQATPSDQVRDFAKNVLPIPVQNMVTAFSGLRPDLSNFDQIAKSAGMSVWNYRTEAEKKIAELSADRVPTGPVDQDKLLEHRLKIQAEDQLRTMLDRLRESGAPPDMLESAVMSERTQLMKEFGQRAAKDVMRNAQLSPMEARASRLPMADLLSVYDVATAQEQAVLSKIILKRRVSFLKEQRQNLSRNEQETDPTFQRVLHWSITQAPPIDFLLQK
jgi:hypothetical protein